MGGNGERGVGERGKERRRRRGREREEEEREGKRRSVKKNFFPSSCSWKDSSKTNYLLINALGISFDSFSD